MIPLLHGNSCSVPKVFPKNWKTTKADPKAIWYIYYRFYSPDLPKGKLIIVKSGINRFETLSDKQDAAKHLLSDVETDLRSGYSPLAKDYIKPKSSNYEIEPSTPICQALQEVLAKIKVAPKTRQDIGNILPHVETAAKAIECHKLEIQNVKKRHIKMILERVGEAKGEKWTANTFNHYRKYLSILFKELVEFEAIDVNPITAITKQSAVTKIRQVLTQEEREKINKHLKQKYYRFWLFMQIFFHSGSRETELLKVKGKDVNLKKQYVKITVIKGAVKKEVNKIIKDVALQYWQEAMEGCGDDQYVFSKGLKPGATSIRPEQITRRWRSHVKVGLGINADFYSLKHLHTDDVAKMLSLQEAGRHNSHTSNKTTLIYAVNEAERQNDRLKKLGNEF